MKKTIIVAAATVIVGAVAFKPVPAAAFFWVPIIMEGQELQSREPVRAEEGQSQQEEEISTDRFTRRQSEMLQTRP